LKHVCAVESVSDEKQIHTGSKQLMGIDVW
jgi:hypothetical protein